MANINLGPSGSMTTLPATVTALPIDLPRMAERSEMSDGSRRVAFKTTYRAWKLSWTKLTAAQITTLRGLHELNITLTFQNNDESATIYTVWVTSFSWTPINLGAGTLMFAAEMTIEQI